MKETISGEVESISPSVVNTSKGQQDRYAIKINGLLLAGFGKCELKIGDKVTATYEKNGQYNNITSIKTEANNTKVNTEITIMHDSIADTFNMLDFWKKDIEQHKIDQTQAFSTILGILAIDRLRRAK